MEDMLESGTINSCSTTTDVFRSCTAGYVPEHGLTENQFKKCKKLLVVKVICQMVAVAFEIDPQILFASRRGTAQVSRARQIAFYLLHTTSSFSLVEIARIFDRDRTTIGHACRLIEDLRDKPAFDDKLKELEKTVRLVHDLATVGM
ncbi:MAG: helix-turn-helix domain-containing protein [Rhizobiaceae bacterium]